MSDWKMEAGAVSTTLQNTTTAYEALSGAITEQLITDIFAGLTWGGGITQCVPQALNDVLSEQQTVNLTGIANHIGAGISGVGNAARQLQAGDEGMAGTFQEQMFTAADSGDFSYFEQHGYSGE